MLCWEFQFCCYGNEYLEIESFLSVLEWADKKTNFDKNDGKLLFQEDDHIKLLAAIFVSSPSNMHDR